MADVDDLTPSQPDDSASTAPGSRAWPIWQRLLVFAVLVAALIAPLVIWRDTFAQAFAVREQVVVEIRDAGPWGPLALIGLTIVQTIIAPIPGQVINFVSGYLFGLAPGLLYAWLGLVLGTILAMLLARYAGRPLIERIVDPRLLAKVDQLALGRGMRFFFLFFLIPGLPDDVLCFAAGLTPLPLRVLVLLSATARVPGVFASVWLGAYAEDVPWPLWIVIGGLGLVALWAVWRYGDRLEVILLRLTERHGG